MEGIAVELAKVVQKHQQVKLQIESLPEKVTNSAQYAQELKILSNQLSTNNRDFYSVVSRYGKAMEKLKMFRTDLDAVWDPGALDSKEKLLQRAIALHLLRDGQFSVSEAFSKEANLPLPESQSQFTEMHRIVESLRNNDLMPAIEWARLHRHELSSHGSSLEFELHRLCFLNLLEKDRGSAIAYSKHNFSSFGDLHLKDIQRLMGALLWSHRLAASPYSDLTHNNMKHDLIRHFTRSYSLIMGLSSESALYTTITVGANALPTIIKMSSILKDKTGVEWTQDGELPVEIPLLDSQRFHSVFSCPVSKEQATEENPAMLLACGHVLVRESLNRLTKGNMATRFKCPYCPIESTGNQAMRIYF